MIINAQGTTRYRNILIGSTGISGTVEHVTIRGLELQEGEQGITVQRFQHVNVLTFDSLLITEYVGKGAIFSNASSPLEYPYTIDSMTIQNCDISSAYLGGQTDGIVIKGATSSVIRNNYIHVRNTSQVAHCDGIEHMDATGLKIYNNIVVLDSVWGNEGSGGATIIQRPCAMGDADSTIIYNNYLIVHGRWSPNAWLGTNLFTRYNTGEDPDAPYFVAHNTIVTRGVTEYVVGLEWPQITTPTFINNIMAQFGSGLGSTPPHWLGLFRNSSDLSYAVDSIRNNLIWREWVSDNPHKLFSWGYWTSNGNTAQNFNWST